MQDVRRRRELDTIYLHLYRIAPKKMYALLSIPATTVVKTAM